MINVAARRLSPIVIALCIFALSACGIAGQRTSAPGSGPPVSQEEIIGAFSGKSYENGQDGQTYYAADGTVKTWQYWKVGDETGYSICNGTWRASGSNFIVKSECKYREDGVIKVSRNETSYEVRAFGYGWDLVSGRGVDELTEGRMVEGFPGEAEFNTLSRQLKG